MPVKYTIRIPNGGTIAANASMAAKIAAEFILTDAVDRTPFEDGDLRRSAKVKPGDASATIVYADVAYARRQHEETTWEHTDGEAKFLTNAAAAKREEALTQARRQLHRMFK